MLGKPFERHHRIFKAVVAYESWRAEMLMREHVASIKSSLVGYLGERKKKPPRRYGITGTSLGGDHGRLSVAQSHDLQRRVRMIMTVGSIVAP